MSDDDEVARTGAMVAFAHRVDEANGLRKIATELVSARAGSLVAFVQGIDETYGLREKTQQKVRSVKQRFAKRLMRGSIGAGIKKLVRDAVDAATPSVAGPAGKIRPHGFKFEAVPAGTTMCQHIYPAWTTEGMRPVALRIYEGAAAFEISDVQCNGRAFFEKPVPAQYFVLPRAIEWDCVVASVCPLLISVTNLSEFGYETLVGVVEFAEPPPPREVGGRFGVDDRPLYARGGI